MDLLTGATQMVVLIAPDVTENEQRHRNADMIARFVLTPQTAEDDDSISTKITADYVSGQNIDDWGNFINTLKTRLMSKSPEEIKDMKREDLEKPVTLEDFDDAIIRCQRSVGNMDLSKYERWIKEYGSY